MEHYLDSPKSAIFATTFSSELLWCTKMLRAAKSRWTQFLEVWRRGEGRGDGRGREKEGGEMGGGGRRREGRWEGEGGGWEGRKGGGGRRREGRWEGEGGG